MSNPSPTSLAVARARLATASGRHKLDVIFDAPDPKALVRSLPAEDLYFAIRDIGLSDSVELVGLASPGQFRSFVDLDAWERDTPDTSRVLLWMRLAMEGARTSGEFRSKRKGLDPELVVLVLKTGCVVHPLEEGVDPELTSDNWLKTAEGKYIVEILAEGDDGVTARKLLEDFIEENPFEATRLFEAVRWEAQTELEENCRRWRVGRLRDMGFPDFEEAIRIWSPLPAGWAPRTELPDAGHVAGVPALLLATSRGQLLLDRVAEKLPDDVRGLFNEGLVYLLNCALVADGIDPKDLDLARGSLAAARDQLSLGLELAAEGDETRALGILASTPPAELFRLAITRLLEVQKLATQAARRVAFGEGLSTALESPDAETLAGIRRRRPRLYAPPSDRQESPSMVGEYRAFRDRADLVLAMQAIGRAQAAGDLLEAFGADVATCRALAEAAGRTPTAVNVSQLGLTALVRAHLGLDGLAPLAADDLPRLSALFVGEKLIGEARQGLEGQLARVVSKVPAAHQEAARGLALLWLRNFESELGPPCAAGPLDARFLETVLVRAP